MTKPTMLVCLALAAAGCDRSATSSASDPASLYRIDGATVTCTGAAWQGDTGDPTVQACRWDCINWDGEKVRYLYLFFHQSGGTWTFNNESIQSAQAGECP